MKGGLSIMDGEQILLPEIGGVVGMEEISTAVSNIFTVVGTVVTQVMSQPVTAMFFVAGIVGLGCGILSRLKRV